MNQGQYVFSQIFSCVSHNDFNKCVSKYNGDYKPSGYLLETVIYVWPSDNQHIERVFLIQYFA